MEGSAVKLTSERVNGIKAGYWSAAKKDELVQKLGAIEHRSAGAAEKYLHRGMSALSGGRQGA